jgi:hypothetical protein
MRKLFIGMILGTILTLVGLNGLFIAGHYKMQHCLNQFFDGNSYKETSQCLNDVTKTEQSIISVILYPSRKLTGR